MRRLPRPFFLFAIFLSSLFAQDSAKPRQIPLPSSKVLNTPSPGRIGAVNSFPAKIALSPDGRYAALLNDGYGTQQTQAHQSITILDLSTNQLNDFPDARLSDTAHQTYFLGLAFGSDGKHLYASMGSITDPTGAKPGNTGNGIAIYRFENGKVIAEALSENCATDHCRRQGGRLRSPQDRGGNRDSISGRLGGDVRKRGRPVVGREQSLR